MIFPYYTGQEAWRKRRYPAHFISKLSDSDGEAAETQVWLDFALDCGYITRRDHDELYAAYENVAGGLVKMMSKPDVWCGPARLREPSAPYSPTLSLSHTSTPPSSPTLPSTHTPTPSSSPTLPLSHTSTPPSSLTLPSSHTPTPLSSHTPPSSETDRP